VPDRAVAMPPLQRSELQPEKMASSADGHGKKPKNDVLPYLLSRNCHGAYHQRA